MPSFETVEPEPPMVMARERHRALAPLQVADAQLRLRQEKIAVGRRCHAPRCTVAHLALALLSSDVLVVALLLVSALCYVSAALPAPLQVDQNRPEVLRRVGCRNPSTEICGTLPSDVNSDYPTAFYSYISISDGCLNFSSCFWSREFSHLGANSTSNYSEPFASEFHVVLQSETGPTSSILVQMSQGSPVTNVVMLLQRLLYR